jgi:hypothetical protein
MHLKLAAMTHESLPPPPVRRPRIEMDIRYRPMERLGGDSCRIVLPDETSCDLTIYDVAGHGLGPGLLATRIDAEVRSMITARLQPGSPESPRSPAPAATSISMWWFASPGRSMPSLRGRRKTTGPSTSAR